MSKFANLEQSLPYAIHNARALEWARDNLEVMKAIERGDKSETEAREYFSRFTMVYAVWLDSETRTTKMHLIKGMEFESATTAKANAIPCTDEAHARRWAAILNTPTDVTPTSRTLRIVAENGERQ